MMSSGNAKPQLGETNNQTVESEEAELGPSVPRATGTTKNQFWMREYWDRYIRDEQHFHSTINYIHNNPVRAGLCKEVHDWPWSSAYAGHRQEWVDTLKLSDLWDVCNFQLPKKIVYRRDANAH